MKWLSCDMCTCWNSERSRYGGSSESRKFGTPPAFHPTAITVRHDSNAMPSSLVSLNHAGMSCCRHSHSHVPLINAFRCSTNLYSTLDARYNNASCSASGCFSRMGLSARKSTQSRSFATTSNPSHGAAHRSAKDDSTGPSRHHSHHSALPYPFPAHANPTPYEIFHLPVGASQSAIKSRCKHTPLVTSIDFEFMYVEQTTTLSDCTIPTHRTVAHSTSLHASRVQDSKPSQPLTML